MSYVPPPNQPPQRANRPPQRPNRRRSSSRRRNQPARRRPATPPGSQPPVDPYGYGSQARQPVGSKRRNRRRGLTLGPGCIFGCFGMIGMVCLGIMVVTFIVYDTYSRRLEDQVAKLDDLANYESFETTVIYDRDGNQLYEVIDQGRRTKITLDQVPPHMIEATISVEDDTFYENRGIDIPSIVRAGWQYMRYGYIVSGGSTITQQLIRNVLFTEDYKYEQSLNRKLDEALLAVILTQRMSKDEILELYLNEIPYGNLAYGVEAAAQTYFGKPASELSLGEAALLAGLPQAPAGLDPLNPDPTVQRRVNDRRKLVLDLMVEEGYITRAEASAAYAEPLNFISPDIKLDAAPHMVVYAQSQLEDVLIEAGIPPDEVKRMVARGGLRVYTSVDMEMQQLAEQTAQAQVSQLRASKNMSNAAVIVMRPDTGEILAMVGSVNYDDETIDGNVNMTIAARQPGSAMKPFTYASFMEKGGTAADIIWDTQTVIPLPGQNPYEPENYDNRFHGPVRVRDALANSYNIPAVQTLRKIGVDYLLWMMNRVGVQSLGDSSQYGLSLTLGGGEVTPLELTTAYSVLANGGLYVPSVAIVCVTNTSGEILYQYEQHCPMEARLTDKSINRIAEGRDVIDPRIAFVISDILSDNRARTPAMGSNSPLYTPGLPTSAKTGTTNDFRDNWTVGYTRNVAVGVWTGNSDNTQMNHISGLEGAAPIWNSVITGIYANPSLVSKLNTSQPTDGHLQSPGGVSQRQICNISYTNLKDPATSCTPGIAEWFLDTPALFPDQNGNLVPGQWPQQAPPSANGPQPQVVEPGLIRVHVVSVEPGLANAIAAADPTGKSAPPRYCQVPIEVVGVVPNVQELLFVAPPPQEYPDDDFRARLWAQSAGVAILPKYACNEQMLSAAPSGGGPAVVTAYISSPTNGQQVSTSQPLTITGTAGFAPGQALFYKVEIKGGQWADFTTMGDVNNNRNAVFDGVLMQVEAWAIPPGNYTLQLVIVGADGNWLQAPYQVYFTVTG